MKRTRSLVGGLIGALLLNGKWRHWLNVDSGYTITAYAGRSKVDDARFGLGWNIGTIPCDQTLNRG
jgi:hypothetical protein